MIGLLGCNPINQEELLDNSIEDKSVVIYSTDSTEWRVLLIKENLLYSDAIKVSVPEPYRLPTREEAQILKICSYPHKKRFITSDGYTFGMPSSSVTKAGGTVKYSVIGLYIYKTVIDVRF